ncbi:uncharacterized protein [Embiotoca jacksoni]|uniref:uncharacterized protein isoform X2 n=1 Tax=Embiotoca jacksoni TaxID=100190 RepID=UPI003703E101
MNSCSGPQEKKFSRMSRTATDVPEPVPDWGPSPPLPDDHVLSSGAVLFPGVFDQHGCPLIVFPAAQQSRLGSDLSQGHVVDFIHYCQALHSKKIHTPSVLSVVVDLKHSSLLTIRFIAETLLLLQRSVHSLYVIQPKKKDAVKLLLKCLTPSKSHAAPFKKVLLKELPELSNYIDRSQLPPSLGGYLVYCHHSWVAFIKEIDAFVQDFLSVVQRLPSCISTLQALSRLPLPSTLNELQRFCSANETKFLQLRRELGLDQLLTRCETVLERLRHPDREPCYQAMAGTALFTHTAFDMLQNRCRITAAVEKVELLWQQTFSKARLQLQVFQLRSDALQITEEIEALLQKKLQPYKIQIAPDAVKAALLVSEFESSIHTPAMALVCCAEDVVHTLAGVLPLDGPTRESWVLDLERLKRKLHSAVHFILQTLRAVSSYQQHYNKANIWYQRVLSENFMSELLSGVHGDAPASQRRRRNWGTIPVWRQKLSSFLKKNPPPDTEELLHLAHLSKAIPDDEVQQAGSRMSGRCLTLRRLLVSSGPVVVEQLQLALQWQYELLRSSCGGPSSANTTTAEVLLSQSQSDVTQCGMDAPGVGPPPSAAGPETVSAEGKPPSLSSFDSGFDGAGNNQPEAGGGREGGEGPSGSGGTRDSVRPAFNPPEIHEEHISSVSDSEDHVEDFDLGSVGNSSRTSIRIVPRVSVDSLNFEIKVKRSAELPSNPWLSLPVDDLENSYTVTVTPQNGDLHLPNPSDPHGTAHRASRSRDQPTQTEVLSGSDLRGPWTTDWTPHRQSRLEDPDLSPISNILSSTITEGGDQSLCTTEGLPTLLWDSYDLHDQDAADGVMDVSLKDWDVKEQEGLREVEQILDRANEILEEEENVLAQEAVLEALLRSDDRETLWPLDREDQLGLMSSRDLFDAGVLGLQDSPDPTESDGLGELRSAESAGGPEDEALYSEAADKGSLGPDLLTELRRVHILDRLIMEENLNIHRLRENPDGELSVREPPEPDGPRSVSREREAFRVQLEKERREVETLESLDQEHHVKKNQARKVVRCSAMERTETEEDRVLCDGLLSQRPSVESVQNHSSCEAESIPPEPGPDVDELLVSQGPDPDGGEARLSLCDRTLDLEEPSELCVCGEEPGGNSVPCSPEAPLTPEMRPDHRAFDPGGTSPLRPVPAPRKASLPVTSYTSCYGPPEPKTLHSTEDLDPGLSSGGPDPGSTRLYPHDEAVCVLPESPTPRIGNGSVLNPNVNEYRNNNNNHTLPESCEVSSEHLEEDEDEEEDDGSEVPICRPLTDSLPAEETPPPSLQQSEVQLPPGPLEFDPGGDERSGGSPGGGQISVMSSHRVSAVVQTSREMADFRTPIVLDTGSGMMKAGFADQDLPNIIFPTIIGTPKYEEIMNGDVERDAYIGHDAQHMRGVLSLRHPIKNGIICNWDDMEKIWHHTFQQLCVDPADHPVLLTEAAMNPLENRQRTVEIMFECFCVPYTYVALQAVLALYAAGRYTGVVLDSGDGVSHSVPVFGGYCLPHAVQRFPLAGADVTVHLKKLLQEQGVVMRTTAEQEIVREMKEKCCCVALHYEAELSRAGLSCREVQYTLPDGQVVALGSERFRAPEILFKPELIGRDHYGMHESVFKSILSSDIDLRRCFLGNIVLSGGNTLLPGLPERLQAEILGLVPADVRDSVRVSSHGDRDFSVWSGGAVLARLPTFSSAWISQEEYEEYGPQIVFRKCF